MEEKYLALLFGMIPTLSTAIILFFFYRAMAKRDKAREKREEAEIERAKKLHENQICRDKLILQMQNANAGLSYTAVAAIKNGKVNGELDRAAKQYDEAFEKYSEFMQMLGVEALRML